MAPEGATAENLDSSRESDPKPDKKADLHVVEKIPVTKEPIELKEEMVAGEKDIKAEGHLKRIAGGNLELRRQEINKIDGQIENEAKDGKLTLTIKGEKPNAEEEEMIAAYQERIKEKGFNTEVEIKSKEIEKEFEAASPEEVFPFWRGGEKIKNAISTDGIGEKKALEVATRKSEGIFKNLREKLGGLEINSRKFWEKVGNKKILGQSAKTFLGSMAAGGVVRYGVKTISGLSGGIAVGMASGAIYGGVWEGTKAFMSESKKIKELFENQEKLDSMAIEIGERKNINLIEKISEYNKLLALEEELGMVEGKNKVYAKILKGLGLSEERIKKTKNGIIKGAIVGGLGGAVGGVLGNYLGGVFQGPEEATAAAQDARKGLGGRAYEHMQEQVSDTYSKTYAMTLEAGLANLDMQEFKMKARPGDGYTNIARNIYHDYIVERRLLGDNFSVNKAKLLFTEDDLAKYLKATYGDKVIQPNDVFSLRGADIFSSYQRSELMTELAQSDLVKNYASNISDQEWARVTDYGQEMEEVNHFSETVLREAEEKSTAAITANDFTEGIAADAALKAREKVADKIVEKGVRQYFDDILSNIGMAYAVEYGEVVEKYINTKRKNKKEEASEPEGHEKWSKIGDVSDEYVGDFEENRNIKKPRTDPIYKYLLGRQGEENIKKLNLKPEDIKYQIRTPSGNMEFNSYRQLRAWYKKLNNEDKEWIKNEEKNPDSPAVRLLLPEHVKEALKGSPKSKESFDKKIEEIFRRLILGKEGITSQNNSQQNAA